MTTAASNLLLRAHQMIGEARCRLYDWRHGVSTCGDVALADLEVIGQNGKHGVSYAPSHPTFLFRLLDGLAIDYKCYQFVDLGFGKGRVLLVASEFPFRGIIGVEFAPEVQDMALDSVRSYKSRTHSCG